MEEGAQSTYEQAPRLHTFRTGDPRASCFWPAVRGVLSNTTRFLPLLGPLIAIILLLTFGPVPFNLLVKFVSSGYNSVIYRWWYTRNFNPWQPTPVILARKSHGRRNLVGYSPWGRKESDMTEWLHFLFMTMGTTNIHGTGPQPLSTSHSLSLPLSRTPRPHLWQRARWSGHCRKAQCPCAAWGSSRRQIMDPLTLKRFEGCRLL